jgi:hypothetical protein
VSQVGDQQAQIQWLVDRAEISDLLFAYAHFIDTTQWEPFFALFTDDAELHYPWHGPLRFGETDMLSVWEEAFRDFWATQHISSNHRIEIDGDRATTTSYVHAAHMRDAANYGDHFDIGGWYRCEMVRTPAGWRIARLRLNCLWQDGGSQAVTQGWGQPGEQRKSMARALDPAAAEG